MLDGPAVPEVVELGLVPANDFRGRAVVALGVERDLWRDSQVLNVGM